MTNASLTETNTFLTVLKFELGRVFRSKAIWGITILMTVKAVLDLATGDWDDLVASGRVARNSAYAAQYFFMYSTFWCAVFGAGLMTMPLLSDLKTRMAPMLYSKPIDGRRYLAAKALSSWVGLVIVTLSLPAGFVLFSYIGAPLGLVEKSLIIPTPWASMTQSYLLWLGLSSIAYGGMHFGLTALTGRAIFSYSLTAFFVVVFFTYAVSFQDIENNQFLIQVTDPVGKQTLDAQIDYWPADQRQRGLIQLTPEFIAQRLLLLTIGLGLLFAAFSTFKLDAFAAKAREESSQKSTPDSATVEARLKNVGGVIWRGAWLKFKLVAITPAFAIVALVFSLMALFTAYSGYSFERIDNFLGLWTPKLLDSVIVQAWIPSVVALVFFASEILSRDQETRMSLLIDATQTTTFKLVASNILALMLLAFTFVLFPIFGTILAQLPNAGEIRWATLLEGGFQYGVLTFPIYAGLTYIVWTLSNNRFVTIGLPIIFMIACLIAFELNQIERQVWLLGFLLEAYWSDFDIGLQGYLKALWHGAVWFSLTALAAVLATLFSRRGIEGDWKARQALARVRATPIALASVAVLAGAFIYSTRTVLYATTVLNDFHTSDQEYAENAAYEKVFGDWRDKPTPMVTAADLSMSIEPRERRMRYVAAFDVVNPNDAPVDAFLVNWAEGLKFVDIRGDAVIDTSRGYGGVEDKDHYGHAVIASFKEPMAPGETRKIEVEVLAHYPFFGNGTILGPIVEDGSTVRPVFLPIIGYDRDRELKQVVRRAAYGLGSRVRPSKEVTARTGATTYPAARYVDMALSVDVNESQFLAASGDPLHSERSDKGARRKHANKGAGSLNVSVVSANFKVTETPLSSVGGVLKVFHHPRHGDNVGRMQDGVNTVIDRYATTFGAFPYDTMQIAEAPHELWGTHHDEAQPYGAGNLIVIPEEEAWMHDYNNKWTFDWVKYLVMEKTLKVWWGDKRIIADIAGADFLSKAVPSYLALVTLDDERQVEAYETYLAEEYRKEQAKIDSIEYPLVESDDEDYMRPKGILALLEAERRIGRKVLIGALSAAYKNSSNEPHGMLEARRVVDEIVAASPAEHRRDVRTLFEDPTADQIVWGASFKAARVAEVNG